MKQLLFTLCSLLALESLAQKSLPYLSGTRVIMRSLDSSQMSYAKSVLLKEDTTIQFINSSADSVLWNLADSLYLIAIHSDNEAYIELKGGYPKQVSRAILSELLGEKYEAISPSGNDSYEGFSMRMPKVVKLKRTSRLGWNEDEEVEQQQEKQASWVNESVVPVNDKMTFNTTITFYIPNDYSFSCGEFYIETEERAKLKELK